MAFHEVRRSTNQVTIADDTTNNEVVVTPLNAVETDYLVDPITKQMYELVDGVYTPFDFAAGSGNVVDTLTATLGAGNNTGGQDIEIDANDKIIFPVDGSGMVNSMIGGSWGMNILADATIILEIDNNLSQIITPYTVVARGGLSVGSASSTDGSVQFQNSDDAAVVIINSPTTKQLKIDNVGHDVEVGINGAAVSGKALAVTGRIRTTDRLELTDSTTTIRQSAADEMLLTASAGVTTSAGLTVLGSIGIGGSGAPDIAKSYIACILPAYDDDAAAGTGGLSEGMFYQTTGSGAAPLNVAGIIMAKQA